MKKIINGLIHKNQNRIELSENQTIIETEKRYEIWENLKMGLKRRITYFNKKNISFISYENENKWILL